jgi:hypothetical protein
LAQSRERLRVCGPEPLGGRPNNIDIASHVALQVRHVEFRGYFIPVTAMLDVAALDQLVQTLRDNVARAADHTADLGRRCRLAPQLSDQNMGPGDLDQTDAPGMQVSFRWLRTNRRTGLCRNLPTDISSLIQSPRRRAKVVYLESRGQATWRSLR